MPPSEPSATAAMLRELKTEGGFTWADLAQAVGGTPEMVRKIARTGAESPGYREAVAHFYQTGRVTSDVRVRRREQALRRPAGVAEPRRYVAPEHRAHHPAPVVEHTLMGRKGRMVTVYVEPYERGARGARRAAMLDAREQARRELMSTLRTAARSKQRVTFQVGFSDDADPKEWLTIGGKGGYAARDALARARGEGDDPLAWLGDTSPDSGGADASGEAQAVLEARQDAEDAAQHRRDVDAATKAAKKKKSPTVADWMDAVEGWGIVQVNVLIYPPGGATGRQ